MKKLDYPEVPLPAGDPDTIPWPAGDLLNMNSGLEFNEAYSKMKLTEQTV